MAAHVMLRGALQLDEPMPGGQEGRRKVADVDRAGRR